MKHLESHIFCDDPEIYTSASIVPFSFVNKHADEPYVLLAKEERHPYTKPHTATAFGGRREHQSQSRKKQADRDIEDTAARELCEECLLAIDYFGTATRFQDFHTLRDRIRMSLKNHEYAFRIPISHPGTHKMHVMFLVEIPWDASVGRRFQAFRQMLHQVQHTPLLAWKSQRAQQRQQTTSQTSQTSPLYRYSEFFQHHPGIRTLPTRGRGRPHNKACRWLKKEYLEKLAVEYISLPMLQEHLAGTAPKHLKLYLKPYMRRRMQVATQFLQRMCRGLRWQSPKTYEIVFKEKLAYHVRPCDDPENPELVSSDKDHEFHYDDRRCEDAARTVQWPNLDINNNNDQNVRPILE